MKIGVIGLGLIGGSLAKAIKKNTTHRRAVFFFLFFGVATIDIVPNIFVTVKSAFFYDVFG